MGHFNDTNAPLYKDHLSTKTIITGSLEWLCLYILEMKSLISHECCLYVALLQEKMLAVQKDDLVVAGAREPVKVNNYVVPTSKKRQELRWEIRTSMAHKEELVL